MTQTITKLTSPARAKGPLVWLDMDQEELDAAYDQTIYAPMIEQHRARFATMSEETRRHVGEPLRLAYGPSEPEKLDVYKVRQANAPMFVFIHGGAWLRGEAKNYAFPAEMFVNAGAHYIALDFTAIGAANGDLTVMAEQVRRAVAWVYKNAEKFGGDRSRLYVGGHSSGGHLCGVCTVTDWEAYGIPADAVRGWMCMSGMYDMKPVRLSKRSAYVKFTDAMEHAMSAMRHIDKLKAPLVVTYGTFESPEFQRQARDFAAAVKAAGKPVTLIEAQNHNHFEMCETLGNPYGPNGRAALHMMGLPA
jgi:arylformamidase